MSAFFSRTVAFLAGALFVLAWNGPAEAKIVRHCKSAYELQYLSINGDSFPNGKRLRFGDFTSRGGCGNLVPNRCRERARSYAQTCMKTHWATRWDRQTPAQCGGASGVLGYGTRDLKRDLELRACCTPGAPSSAREVVVALRGVTEGDKRCPGVLEFTRTYRIDCREVAAGFKACGGE